MKFTTHNQKEINIDGTHLVGTLTANYADIKKIFGKSTENFDDYKCDAEWEIEFEDGKVATIYNWKDGKNYCGKSGLPKSKITNWHIGGKDSSVIENLEKLLAPKLLN
jgi:major membrane immunogen (membrane-anchored lipoprotein)